ncbi:MAG: HAD family phosphatase [Candidatus Omnitrophica bacterium]|nr:HAD family phosphatase [Candidatus Omnitrophota bacterium]
MKYDLIIFDLGNVILRFDHNISAAKITRRFGLKQKVVYDLFFESEATLLHDEGKISSREFFTRITKQLGIKISFGEFKNYWCNIFSPNKGMIPLVKRLRKKYKVYLMSNINRLHFDFIKKNFSVIKNFDGVILSYKVHALKPDPRIYKEAFRRAKTKPARTVYIDDRRDLIELSRPLGMNNILFINPGQLKRDLKKLSVDT